MATHIEQQCCWATLGDLYENASEFLCERGTPPLRFFSSQKLAELFLIQFGSNLHNGMGGYVPPTSYQTMTMTMIHVKLFLSDQDSQYFNTLFLEADSNVIRLFMKLKITPPFLRHIRARRWYSCRNFFHPDFTAQTEHS